MVPRSRALHRAADDRPEVDRLPDPDGALPGRDRTARIWPAGSTDRVQERSVQDVRRADRKHPGRHRDPDVPRPVRARGAPSAAEVGAGWASPEWPDPPGANGARWGA